jgi:hypothetical protein
MSMDLTLCGQEVNFNSTVRSWQDNRGAAVKHPADGGYSKKVELFKLWRSSDFRTLFINVS